MLQKREVVREIVRDALFKGVVLFDEQMRNHTTLRIGGPAEVFVVPEDLISLKNVIAGASDQGIALTPLGAGSNVLVSDDGIDGMVVTIPSLNAIRVISDTVGEVKVLVEGGTPLQKVVTFAKEQGLAGVEGLIGIPGFIAGAVKGNAGSFGYETGTVVESVTVLDRAGRPHVIKREDICFRYRGSGISDDHFIVGVTVNLVKDDSAAVSERSERFLREKREKHPLSQWSAGCVFKNPSGAFAGRLIEEAGCKGLRRGDVGVSTVHANYFVNEGDGKASDFRALMEDVREKVRSVFGIELDPEIQFLGEQAR